MPDQPRRSGAPFIARPSGGLAATSAGSARDSSARPADRPTHAASRATSDEHDAPTRDRGLDPERLREQLDEAVGRAGRTC